MSIENEIGWGLKWSLLTPEPNPTGHLQDGFVRDEDA